MKTKLLILVLLSFLCLSKAASQTWIRTNGLFDLAVIPNVGFEFGLGGKVSLGTDFYMSFLNTSDHKSKGWAGTVELRYYFKEKFKGHHLGATASYYNVDEGKVFIFDPYLKNGGGFGYGLLYGYTIAFTDNFLMSIDLGCEYTGLKGYWMLYDASNDRYVHPNDNKDSNGNPDPLGKTKKNYVLPRGGITLSWRLGGRDKSCPRYDSYRSYKY